MRTEEVTFVTRTQPSGPLCLWQCFMVSLNINGVNDFFICWQLTCILFCSSSIKYSRVSHCFHSPLQYSNVLSRGSLLALKLSEVNTDPLDLISGFLNSLGSSSWQTLGDQISANFKNSDILLDAWSNGKNPLSSSLT